MGVGGRPAGALSTIVPLSTQDAAGTGAGAAPVPALLGPPTVTRPQSEASAPPQPCTRTWPLSSQLRRRPEASSPGGARSTSTKPSPSLSSEGRFPHLLCSGRDGCPRCPLLWVTQQVPHSQGFPSKAVQDGPCCHQSHLRGDSSQGLRVVLGLSSTPGWGWSPSDSTQSHWKRWDRQG